MPDRHSLARLVTPQLGPAASLGGHLLRGVVGFGAIVGSVALIPWLGPVSLVMLPLGLLALRGCPTCWLVSLRATLSAGRLERHCVDGRCELRPASR